jgi:hypothetical protein
LQPNIFMTGKRLAPLVRSAIMSNPRARTYDGVDATEVFDAAEGEIFYDLLPCRRCGCKIVADRMIVLISARSQ